MKKIICDVCGRDIAPARHVNCFFFYPKEYSQFKNGGNKKYDLCIDCAKAIREVMEEKPKEDLEPESPWVHYEKREVGKDPVENLLITEDDGFITRHDSHGMDIKEGTK